MRCYTKQKVDVMCTKIGLNGSGLVRTPGLPGMRSLLDAMVITSFFCIDLEN